MNGPISRKGIPMKGFPLFKPLHNNFVTVVLDVKQMFVFVFEVGHNG